MLAFRRMTGLVHCNASLLLSAPVVVLGTPACPATSMVVRCSESSTLGTIRFLSHFSCEHHGTRANEDQNGQQNKSLQDSHFYRFPFPCN